MSVLSCLPGQQGVAARPAAAPKGRKIKSEPAGAVAAADRHERAKDYLSPAEMAGLLDARCSRLDGDRRMIYGDRRNLWMSG